jgi:putative Holliday junction resolvase
MIVDEGGKKVLAIDWGAKRIGLAVSDPTGKLARPLTVIQHISREENACRILDQAKMAEADVIVIGVTYADGDEVSPSGRSAQRLAEEIEKQSTFKVILWDEEFTTREVKESMIRSGISRSKRRGHADDRAAATLLQNYLNSLDT